MLSFGDAAKSGQRTRSEALDTQVCEAGRGPHDIGDRIPGAHLVEVDLFRRRAVDFRFYLGDTVEDGQRQLLHALWERGASEQLADHFIGPAMAFVSVGVSSLLMRVLMRVLMIMIMPVIMPVVMVMVMGMSMTFLVVRVMVGLGL